MLTSSAIEFAAGPAAVAALCLAAGGYAYAAMNPGSQLFGSTLTAPRKPGELALTFDDGPNPACTPRLLDTLASNNIKAAFFLIGGFALAQPGLVHRILAGGHLIGNHSWTHPNLAIASDDQVDDELTRTTDTLQQIAGAPIRYFRPPYGARRPHVLRAARRLGMTPVLWNTMTNDWSDPSADAISARLGQMIDNHQRRGRASTIVLHDGNHRQLGGERDPSVTAAGQLIARYKQSHHFVTLDAWS